MSNHSTRNVRFEPNRDILIKSKNGRTLLRLRYRMPYGGIDGAGNKHYVIIEQDMDTGLDIVKKRKDLKRC